MKKKHSIACIIFTEKPPIGLHAYVIKMFILLQFY